MRTRLIASVGAAMALVSSVGFTAEAALHRFGSDHMPRSHDMRRHDIDPFSVGRGGGPVHRIYPREYDGLRAFHGGRHDNRWRWNPDPGNAPSNLGPPFGWPGGSPWSW